MATGGKPLNVTEGEKWVPPVGKPQMDAREDNVKKDHNDSRYGISTQRIELKSNDHLLMLKELDFEDHVKQSRVPFKGKFDYEDKGMKSYLQVQCSSEVRSIIDGMKDTFISSIVPISLDPNIKDLLSEKGSNHASYLKRELKKRNVNIFLVNRTEIFMYTLQKYEEEVKDTISSIFGCMTICPEEARYFYFTTPEFQTFREKHENKDFRFRRKDGVLSFAALKSVAEELLEKMALYEKNQDEFSFTPTQIEAIQNWNADGKEKNWLFLNKLYSKGKYIYTRKALLLKKKPTEKYIKQKIKTSSIKALIEAESDVCVNLIAFNESAAKRAEEALEKNIGKFGICFTDEIQKMIESTEFRAYFATWEGKFIFDGLDTDQKDPEGTVFATDDVIHKLEDFLESNFCIQTRSIIPPNLCRKFETQANLGEIERQYHCEISKKLLEPHLTKCWVGNKNSNFCRVHIIAEHAESLNVDALLCPCSTSMFPLNECFRACSDIKSYISTAKKHMKDIEEIVAPDEFPCKHIIFLVAHGTNKPETIELSSVMKKILKKADELSCKTLAIPISILSEDIIKKTAQVREIAKALKNISDLKNLEEVFVCECSYHPSHQMLKQWDRVFGEFERCIDFNPLQESAMRMTIPTKESTHGSKISVKTEIGSLDSQQVDAIVNTCRRDLNLDFGAVSQSIRMKGGESIQKELNEKYSTHLRFGEVAVTNGGDLHCQYIFHSSLYHWKSVGNFSLKVLKLVIWNCLEKADELKCSSIAFPSLGTGKLLYPFQLVAETMYHTIQCYERCHSDTRIKDISIVLYGNDLECIDQFNAVEKMRETVFQPREECHPPQYLTCHKMVASESVTVDLLPCTSKWRWGCLLKVVYGSGDNGKEMVWDQNEYCWKLRLSPPGILSSMPSISAISSYLGISPDEPHDIVKKRITSIKLILLKNTDGYKKQIENFFKIMNGIKNHFIEYIFIVFPNITFDELMKESKSIEGHWKPGRKVDDFPVTYMLSGSPQDVSRAKAEIDDMITKMERDLHQRKLKDAAHGSSVDPDMNDFLIFETVTGVLMCADTKEASGIEEMKKIIEDTGCKAKMDNNNMSIHIEGNFSQIVKANQRLIERCEKDISKMGTMGETVSIVSIPMSKWDFQAVKFFGNKLDWFKRISNQVMYTEGFLFIPDVDVDSTQKIENDINQLLSNVKMMSSDNVLINVNDFELKKAMQDVEQKKPNVCLIKKENDIEIISESYTELQEAKGLLVQLSKGKTNGNLQMSAGKANRRANRTFTKTEEESKNLQMLEDTNQGANSTNIPLNMNQSMRSRKVELKTNEGLMIKIYLGSITRLDVDCIVNAANESLMHGGGVAAAISEAAGYQFDQESKDYVQKYGPIPVGTCCVTSAGKLPYKYVIHTVGPRWGEYRDKNRCLQDLQYSVEATFIEADKRKMNSIAIPAISSGIFAVPRDKCVEEYYRAAMSFSTTYSFKNLREIHFVDRDETMVRAIQELFLQREPSATIIGKSETIEKKNDTNAFVVEETVHSTMPLSNSYTTVTVSNSLQIRIHIGNITDIAAEAIVCPQDENCLSKDAISKEIFRMIPDKQPLPKKMRYGDICSQELKENSKWKMIIHAVTPVYDSEYAKDHSEFVKILKTTIQKIIKTADEAKLHSIAIPLLGTGTEEYRTPVETCASSFFKAVMANKSELMYLNDIYLVLKEEKQEKMYLEDFAFINCKITQRPVTNNGKSDDFGKTMKEMPKDGENCCICMDTPTKPKQLRKCGHIFCKECIEQYFEYKPTCPSCGTIYGKVTGDQPPGTMSIRTNGSRLQGFNDSSGTIVLTYFFNDGNQGEEHPDPGKVYKGFSRSGYLPNNKRGRLIAKLLNVAFSRRLVFTIGRSRTTGHDGVITWNDIHHKTRMEGGPARFGYPDPTYLDRVLEELEAKGVTDESADDPEEYKEYSRQIRY